MEITYDRVYPLVAQAEQQGSSMQVTFKCPMSGEQFQATGHIHHENTVGDAVKSSVKRSLFWSIRSGIARSVSRAMGYGIAGRAASSVVYNASSPGGHQQSFSEEDKKQGIVNAFKSVENQFAWEAAQNRFISAKSAGSVLPEFFNQLNSHPVTAPYDRSVMARVLVEIAMADGHLGDEEKVFLAGMITPDIGTIEQLSGYAPLSPAELGETTQGPGRDTMLMLGWALAYSDEEVAPQEYARLAELASGLGIDSGRSGELCGYAQSYIIDQALGSVYADGQRNQEAYDAVMALAQRIGLDATSAERADIRYRKRYGLV